MKLAYLDCFSGISGDMLLGAFVACGAELKDIEREVSKLGIPGLTWHEERVKRGSLMGTRVVVDVAEKQRHRHLTDIVQMIRAAGLSKRVEEQAASIFQRLGEAEARLHGWPIEKVHFHEVGAVDSIADIVGGCVALEILGIDELHCSALNVGGGTVNCEHGTLPVPAPATAELLKGLPIYSSGIESELVTPTGAAIVSALAKSFGAIPAMKSSNIGYGAGSRDHASLPNLLRVTIGESENGDANLERLWMIESNIDDMNPQLFASFAERAFAAGALDVYFAPVQMKKNRPAVLLSLLCRAEMREPMMDLFFCETTTLGVRCYEVLRRALERETVIVSTPHGDVRVKVARRNGQVLNISPEFDDCKRLADEKSVPVKKVVEDAGFSFWSKFGIAN